MSARAAASLLLLAAGLGAAGCASIPLAASYAGPQPLPAEVAAYYAYPRPPREATAEPLAANASWRETLIRFPLAAEGFTPTEPVVEIEWFESLGPGPRPAIVFNPILGGNYPLERGLCRFLARHGFHVAMVRRKTLKISPEHEVERIEVLLRQGVVRIRQVVDWLAAQPGVDPQRLGSFGISMGGIAGAIVAALEPRLQVHLIALAGGPIPDILVASQDTLLTRPRNRYLKQRGMDLGTFEAALRRTIRTDPVALAPYADARRIVMVIALADRTIGARHALRLWRALGRPRATFLPLGHYTAYLSLPYLKRLSLQVFRERFGVPPDG
jgi:hypothetical protein